MSIRRQINVLIRNPKRALKPKSKKGKLVLLGAAAAGAYLLLRPKKASAQGASVTPVGTVPQTPGVIGGPGQTVVELAANPAPAKVRFPYSVTQLQEALIAGCYLAPPADGINGPNTKAALRAYQADNGLTVDGIAGPQVAANMDLYYDFSTSPVAPQVAPTGACSSGGGGGDSMAKYAYWNRAS